MLTGPILLRILLYSIERKIANDLVVPLAGGVGALGRYLLRARGRCNHRAGAIHKLDILRGARNVVEQE